MDIRFRVDQDSFQIPSPRENAVKTGNFGKITLSVISRRMGFFLVCVLVVVASIGSECGGAKVPELPELPEKMPQDFGFAAFSKTEVVWYLEVASEAGGSWKAKYTYAASAAEFVAGKGTQRVFFMSPDQVQEVYDRLRQMKFLQIPAEPLPPPPEPRSLNEVEELHSFMLQVSYGQAGLDRVEHEVHWWDTNKADGAVASLRETLHYIESLVEVDERQTSR